MDEKKTFGVISLRTISMEYLIFPLVIRLNAKALIDKL